MPPLRATWLAPAVCSDGTPCDEPQHICKIETLPEDGRRIEIMKCRRYGSKAPKPAGSQEGEDFY